ncbi:MAG: PAS domain-containing protein, partial [Sphingomicrobium sp.]
DATPAIARRPKASIRKNMADSGRNSGKTAANTPRPPAPPTSSEQAPAILPANLPPEMFSGPGLLALSDLLPVMTGYVDRDLRMQFINRPFAEWLGRPRRDLIGATMRDILGDDAFAQRLPMIEAALGGDQQFFVADLDHPSRGQLAAQTTYVPWVRDGQVVGLVIVVVDVTEQRVAERALRESEARFRRIANSAPAMMWVTRLDRVRDFVNDHYVEFVAGPGGDRAAAEQLDWRSLIHPDDVDRVVADSLAGEASLQAFGLEARYLRHDGEWRWLKSVSQPRFGPDGELTGFIGVASDITLSKEAELELRRQVEDQTRELSLSEARFRAVFDTVLEVLVLMTPSGTVVELNRKEVPWRARNARDGIGLKIWDAPTLAAYPQHQPLIKRAVREAASGKLFTSEVRMEREGVPTAHIDVSVQPVRNSEGEIVYLLFEARDVTELKAAQEQLRQSQKMEALGQLTGGIAHDFNNLLTVVVGGLDIVAKRVEEPRLKRFADNALAAAERGARLTGQLLAFSRVQRLEVQPTFIAPLIQNMRPLLKNVLGPGIEKRFDLDDAMIPIMADPTQVEVAVLNLAINARDAMPDGGVLTFSSQRVTIDTDGDLAAGEYIELTIADTGAGMPPEVVERAFEPFFTTKEVGKGTGLGLSMVYGMARQSGGVARIRSTAGTGTAVSLLFRKADETVVEAEPASDEPMAETRAVTSQSILVIDDDPDVRGFIAAALEEQGYRVHQANDGTEGLAEMALEKFDLVIIDFIMPGLSGAEVAEQILGGAPEQPILFVSGYSETEAVKRTAPNALLLAKPFRPDALQRAVRTALAPAN